MTLIIAAVEVADLWKGFTHFTHPESGRNSFPRISSNRGTDGGSKTLSLYAAPSPHEHGKSQESTTEVPQDSSKTAEVPGHTNY